MRSSKEEYPSCATDTSTLFGEVDGAMASKGEETTAQSHAKSRHERQLQWPLTGSGVVGARREENAAG
jgi:hypothetical protein